MEEQHLREETFSNGKKKDWGDTKVLNPTGRTLQVLEKSYTKQDLN